MKSTTVLLVVWAALLCASASAVNDIWPQQLAFEPPSGSDGWDSLTNSATDLIADTVFFAHPYVVTPDNVDDSSPNQLGTWGFSVTEDGFIPSFDIDDEKIDVYISSVDLVLFRSWEKSDSGETDGDGEFNADLVELPAKGVVYPSLHLLRPINYFGRSAIWNFLPGTNAVLFDVDGTITTSDFQALCTSSQLCDADIWEDAQKAVQGWYDKGYQVVYLSGRPASFYTLTVEFLIDNGFAPGLLRCSDDIDEAVNDIENYKTKYLNLLKSAGLVFKYAYGNALTDIAAYDNAGIDKDVTFIIGENGGKSDTQDLGNSYSGHLSFIASAPAALVPGIRLNGDIGTVTNDGSSSSSNNTPSSNNNTPDVVDTNTVNTDSNQDTNSNTTNDTNSKPNSETNSQSNGLPTISEVIPVTDSGTNNVSSASALIPSLLALASLFALLF